MGYVVAANSNGWGEWSKFVLKELERLNTCIGHIDEEMKRVSVEIAMLKVKSGVWGLIGGCIPIVISLVYFWLKKQP